jgi:pyruvate dehydrogenase E2 component (dihydrolipoamide acetyltransferase)
MAHIVTMPKLGLTMTEGVVTKWHKAEGESIEQGEVLLEITTEKITNEVEAPVSGLLRRVLAEEGMSLPVGDALAIIGDAGEDITGLLRQLGLADTSDGVAAGTMDSAAALKPGHRPLIKASPAAKKMARDTGVDLSAITGTGPGGRIVQKDVAAFLEARDKKVKASPVAIKAAADLGVDIGAIDKGRRIMKEDIISAAQGFAKTGGADRGSNDAICAVSSAGRPEQFKKVAPSVMRRVIADRMTASWHTAPMVTLNLAVDVTALKAFRAGLKDECEAQGVKLSYNDILIKICAKALMEYPFVNASYDGQDILYHNDANIGLAIALDGGLIVPNVKAAQSKSLIQIATETGTLIAKAKENRLTTEDVTGGTFTITNLGMFGIVTFTPIINQPESAILGVNAMEDRPVVVDGQVVIRPMMNLSLTIDHRMIDGADGARFLARIKELIENPLLLML